jgi:crotonobetainyl-CoA:carnitine CoA-transferase CaiB-like acyl-CoA transferase
MSGLFVLEIGDDPAVGFAGRLLAQSGLTVVKLELTPGGDESRRAAPQYRAADRLAGASVLFHYLNQGKRSIAVNISVAQGRELVVALVRQAGITLVDARGAATAGLADVVREQRADGAQVWISPFGLDGPRSGENAAPATIFASAGEASTLPGGLGYQTHPDAAPLVARGHLVDFDTGVIAAMCAAAALHRRVASADPIIVDVTKHECETSLNRWLVTHFIASGWIESRATRAYAFAGLMRCSDGYAMLQPTTDGHWAGLKHMMGDPQWADAPEFATQDLRLKAGAVIQQRIAAWASQTTTTQLFEAALRNNVPAAPFRSMADVAACPQFAARGYIASYGMAGRLPSLPFAPHPQLAPDRGSAPDLGQHNEEILAGQLGLSPVQLDELAVTAVVPALNAHRAPSTEQEGAQ